MKTLLRLVFKGAMLTFKFIEPIKSERGGNSKLSNKIWNLDKN